MSRVAYHRILCRQYAGGWVRRKIRVGQNHIYTVILAGKSPKIQSYMVCIYDFWPTLRKIQLLACNKECQG